MESQPLVQADHLQRYFGPVPAVQDVTLQVHRGEVLGLLGLNGAGKSTTLAMLAGVLEPGAGRVEIAGHSMAREPLAARGALGYLPDTPPLYDQQSVDEYLELAAALRGVPRSRRGAQVAQAKDRCGLGSVSRRLLGNLSKGYRQRVGIAQALVHDPAVVLLDEPSSGLDPAQLQAVRGLIRDLSSDHAVIFSTHLLVEAQAVCDRVQIIHHGRVIHGSDLSPRGTASSDRPLRLVLEGSPARERIATLDGVADCVSCGAGVFRVHLAAGSMPDTLVRALVSHGLPLLEMTRERDDLEQLFIAVTTGAGSLPTTQSPPQC
jgi:ABC-2 type transport system ATP-binding protein